MVRMANGIFEMAISTPCDSISLESFFHSVSSKLCPFQDYDRPGCVHPLSDIFDPASCCWISKSFRTSAQMEWSLPNHWRSLRLGVCRQAFGHQGWENTAWFSPSILLVSTTLDGTGVYNRVRRVSFWALLWIATEGTHIRLGWRRTLFGPSDIPRL